MGEKLFQFKLGEPFFLKEIDRLFYVCTFISTNKSFVFDKEKFEVLFNKGFVTEYKIASSL